MIKYLFPALMLLSGCSSTQIERAPSIEVVAVTNKLTLDLQGKGLSLQQQQDVRGFIERKGSPYGLKAKVVSHSKVGRAQSKRIVHILVQQGLALSHIEQQHVQQTQGGDIQIMVESFRAKVPACQKKQYANTLFNEYKAHPAFGCANQSALAQMVANPKDLIVGESLGATNGAKAVSTMDAYVAPAAPAATSNGAQAAQANLLSAFGAN